MILVDLQNYLMGSLTREIENNVIIIYNGNNFHLPTLCYDFNVKGRLMSAALCIIQSVGKYCSHF